jgi:hypothetical protein
MLAVCPCRMASRYAPASWAAPHRVGYGFDLMVQYCPGHWATTFWGLCHDMHIPVFPLPLCLGQASVAASCISCSWHLASRSHHITCSSLLKFSQRFWVVCLTTAMIPINCLSSILVIFLSDSLWPALIVLILLLSHSWLALSPFWVLSRLLFCLGW